MVGLLNRFKEDRVRHGWRRTLGAWWLHATKRVAGYTVLQGIRLRQLPTEASEEPAGFSGYHWGFVSRYQLERFAHSEVHELDSAFVEQALARGDDCFGVFEGDELVAYSWYSTQPTLAEDGFWISCSKKYVYMYKAFTHPAYRGQRLYAFGVKNAVREYLRLGFQGMICYVQPQNLASMKALARIGCQTFGTVSYFRGSRQVYHSAGCREMGFIASTHRPRVAATMAPEFEKVRR